jgi:hypothetical protein
LEGILWEHYNGNRKIGDPHYLTFPEWKTKKNKYGGPVGLDFKNSVVDRLDSEELKEMMK